MRVAKILFSSIVLMLVLNHATLAEPSAPSIKIGFIGSLSSFAAEYGQASLAGAQAAVAELKKSGVEVSLIVEDDGSDTKRTVQAFNKLVSVDHVSVIVTGTWWAMAIVSLAERSNVLLLSAETLEEQSSVHGKTYFILQGYLADWIDAYESTMVARGWKSAAIIRFVSTFGETLSRQLQSHFSKPDRTFLGDLTYASIDMSDAHSIALKIKKINPEVVYIDAQPEAYPVIIRRLRELGTGASLTVLGNSGLKGLLERQVVSPEGFKEICYTQRRSYSPEFVKLFTEIHGKSPILNADLGYVGLKLAVAAAQSADPVAFLENHPRVDGVTYAFDRNHVHRGAPQEVVCLSSR